MEDADYYASFNPDSMLESGTIGKGAKVIRGPYASLDHVPVSSIWICIEGAEYDEHELGTYSYTLAPATVVRV